MYGKLKQLIKVNENDRLFGAKCDKCGSGFSRSDFVMRAKAKIYHIECFRCTACQRQLVPGDEFALRDDGLYCKDDHEVNTNIVNSASTAAALLEAKTENSNSSSSATFTKSNNNNNNNLSFNHNISNSSLACSTETSGRHSRANSNDSHSGTWSITYIITCYCFRECALQRSASRLHRNTRQPITSITQPFAKGSNQLGTNVNAITDQRLYALLSASIEP